MRIKRKIVAALLGLVLVAAGMFANTPVASAGPASWHPPIPAGYVRSYTAGESFVDTGCFGGGTTGYCDIIGYGGSAARGMQYRWYVFQSQLAGNLQPFSNKIGAMRVYTFPTCTTSQYWSKGSTTALNWVSPYSYPGPNATQANMWRNINCPAGSAYGGGVTFYENGVESLSSGAVCYTGTHATNGRYWECAAG